MGNNDTKLSTANILNRSYDPALDVIVVENISKDGDLINPATEAKQDSIIEAIEDYLINYKLSDIDEQTNITYIGYLKKDGAWYIMKIVETETENNITYATGSSNYNWSNRASENYGLFNIKF